MGDGHDPSEIADQLTDLRKAKKFADALRIVDDLPTRLTFQSGKLASAVAQVLFEGGQKNKAMAFLKITIVELKDDVRLQNLYAKYLVNTGRTNEAFDFIEKTLERFPDNDSALNLMAAIHIGRKQYGIAQDILLHNIARNPKDRYAQQTLASMYAETGRWGSALAILLNLFEKEPNNMRTAAFLATCHVGAGDLRQGEHVLHTICNSREAIFDMSMLHTVTTLARHGFATRLHQSVIETAKRNHLVRPEVLSNFEIRTYPEMQPEKVSPQEMAQEIYKTIRFRKSPVGNGIGNRRAADWRTGITVSHTDSDRTMRL